MIETITAVARAAAAVLPMTLLSLGLVFVVIVAVLRPTPDRLDMVDRLGRAIKDLGTVIAAPGRI